MITVAIPDDKHSQEYLINITFGQAMDLIRVQDGSDIPLWWMKGGHDRDLNT